MEKLQEIKTGDLLTWSKDKYSRSSNMFLGAIRLATRSNYAHVAPVWRRQGELYVVDATMPRVRFTLVRPDDEFYHIPVFAPWKKEAEDFLTTVVGCEYSLMDCLRAYFGRTTEKDDQWQCAEICNNLYKILGLDMGDAYTPTAVIERLLELQDTHICKYVPRKM